MMALQTDTHDQTEALRVRLGEAEEMLRAIRHGEIDALVVEGVTGNQVYTLHSAEEPYRNLVEQMHEGAAVLTGHGDILYANARFAALAGEPLESVVGSPFDRFVDPDDRNEFDALWAAGRGRCRARLIGPDAVPLDVSISLTTTATNNGGRRNLIVTDLRELVEASTRRDRAERDNRTKDDFLATLAHELRNPLNAIGIAVQVLETTHASGDGAARAHDVIMRQVSHVTHLIEDLLDIERVVSGKMRLDRQSLDMCEVVRRTVATFAADARLDRRIEVTTEPAWIDGDAMRIEQVLSNLITNAVKYTPRGGVIRVALQADGADAVLSVEDSGLGISPSLLPFIFDMYVQADKTLDRARGGLGIGLALVRRLVEMHGGTVAASSDGEGKGSTFTARLRRSPMADSTRHLPARPRRVLLIEDSGEARETLRMMLELAGHVVHVAPDGVRGLELLDVVHPDVGIIDVGLPTVDGYQVARQIRADTHGRRMLLLAVSGGGLPVDSRRSLAHGFDYHLVKPVDPELLGRLMSQVA